MTWTRVTTDLPKSEQPSDSATAPSQTKRVRSRRNPRLMVLGIVAALGGSVVGAWMLTTISQTAPVLVVARPVPAGAVITAQDLTTAQLPADPVIAAIPATDRQTVLGQRAATNLVAGAVLAPGSTTADPVPAPQMSVVGVSLKPSQMPAMPLGVGDEVRVVVGVRDGDPLPDGDAKELRAVVTDLQVGEDGTSVVDLTVPEAQANELAVWASTGRVVLVVDSAAQR